MYDIIHLCILIYVIILHKMNISTKYHDKLISSPICFENAYTRLTTLSKRSNRTNVYFDFVSIIMLHEYFLKKPCGSHFIIDLVDTRNLWDVKS